MIENGPNSKTLPTEPVLLSAGEQPVARRAPGAAKSSSKGFWARVGDRLGLVGVRQRDDALAHRDKMKMQRDEARAQRDKLKGRLSSVAEGGDESNAGPAASAMIRTAPSATPNYERAAETVASLRAAVDKLSRDLGMPDKTASLDGKQALSPAELQARLFSYANFYKLEQIRRAWEPEIRAKIASGEPLTTTEQEVLVERHTPVMHKKLLERRCPPRSVAFLTVANDRFLPGLTGLLLSLLDVYPALASDVLIYHDGTISPFAQRQLSAIYPRIRFIVPDLEWLEVVSHESDNQKRIGKLGYMNLYAFTHEEYDRVIAFDSDLLIIDDISALWEGGGDDFRACHDCGHREYVAKSQHTGAYIINSGVISIPKRFLNKATFEEAKIVAQSSLLPLHDLIDRFADQKAWNIFLKDKPVTLLDGNYNCNIKYVIRHLGGNLESVSVIHFAGAKPWNNQIYLHDQLVTEFKAKALAFPKIWSDHYRRLLFRHRLKVFRRDTKDDRRSPVLETIPGETPTCVMIGNGPSIAETPLERLEGLETICYNWFILHERFEAVRPQHLVLASHMFFGGWNTQKPEFPISYLNKLRELKHRPALWVSYYFKPLIDELGLADDFEVNYLLFEKPFKRFIDSLGSTHCDIDGFLDDGRTGVISFGAPIALALGFKRIVLVGCDSNYNAGGSHGLNYFYDSALHTSLSTKSDALTATWQPGGPGHFAYDAVSDALKVKGVHMLDATVGGGLAIRKLAMDDLLRDAERARMLRSPSRTAAAMLTA